MVPIPYYVNLAPLFLLCFIVLASFTKFFFLIFKAQTLKQSLVHDIVVNPTMLEKLINNWGISKQTYVIKSRKKFAFCLGIRKPKIYISTSLISQLSSSEVEAVLLHEKYHIRKHDTFTMIIATFADSIFPFFPLLGDLTQSYRIHREIEADKFAVNQVGDKGPLISALKKLLLHPSAKIVTVLAIAEQNTLEPRIYSLLNKQYPNKLFRFGNLIITIVSSLLVTAILVFPVHATEIHSDMHDVVMVCTDGVCANSCASEKSLNRLYSPMPNASTPFTPGHK